MNGYLGDHGCAILLARNEHALETDVETDCQSLADLVRAMLAVCPDIHCLRDATRGGLATVLNEFAQSSRVGIRVEENQLLLCFDVCAKGTVVEGAQLEILEIAGLAICRQCRAEVVLQQLFGRCACGSNDLEQIAGSELKVKEMETI